jgi:hypothetical protein
MNNKSMSSTTTHLMIKLLPVSQSLMKGMGVSVFESNSMNHNIAIEANPELISGIYNFKFRIGGLVSSSSLISK